MAPENYATATPGINTALNEICPENTFTEDIIITEDCTAIFEGTGDMSVFKKVNETDNYQLIKKLETSDNNMSNRIVELQWSSRKITYDIINETPVGSDIATSNFEPTSGSNDPFAISETVALNAGDVVYYTPSDTLSAIIKADGEEFWEHDVTLVAKFNSNSEQAFIIEEQGLYCFMYKGNTAGLPILKVNSIEPNVISLTPGTYIFGPQANIENVYINYTLLNGEKESIVYDGSKLQELFNELTKSELSDVPYTYIRNYLYEDCDFDTFKNYKNDNLEKQREVIEGLNSVILNRQQLPALMLNAFYLTSLEKPLPLEVILQTNHLPAGYTTVYNEEQMDTNNEVFVEKTSKKIISERTIKTFIGKPTYENRGGIEQIFTPTISYKGSPLYDNDKNENYPINGQIIPANVKAETYEEFSARTPYLIGATDFKKSTKPEGLNVIKADNKYEISTQNTANNFLPIHIIDKIFMPQVTMWSNINQIPLYYPAGTSKDFIIQTTNYSHTSYVLTKRGFVSFNIYNGVISSEKNNYVKFVTQEINGKQFKILRNQQDDEERCPVRRTLINDASKLTTVRNYVIPDDDKYLNFKNGNNTDCTYAMNIPSRDFDIELIDEKGDSAFIDSFSGDFKIELLEDSSYREISGKDSVLNFTTNDGSNEVKFYLFALPAVYGNNSNHYENTKSYPLNAFYDYLHKKAFDAIPKIILKEPEKYYTLKAGQTAPSGYENAITKEQYGSLSNEDKPKYEFSAPEIGINDYYKLSQHRQDFYNTEGNRLYIEDAWEFKEDGSDAHNFFSVNTTPEVLKNIATSQYSVWYHTDKPMGEVIYYDIDGNEIETTERCYSNTGNFNLYRATNAVFAVAVNSNGQRAISPVYDLKTLEFKATSIPICEKFQLNLERYRDDFAEIYCYAGRFIYEPSTYNTTLKIYENDDHVIYHVYPYYLAKYEFKCETINPNGDNYTSILSPENVTVHTDSTDEEDTYIEFQHEGLVNEDTQVNITDITKLKHYCKRNKLESKDEKRVKITWRINYDEHDGNYNKDGNNQWRDDEKEDKTTTAKINISKIVVEDEDEPFDKVTLTGRPPLAMPLITGNHSAIEGWYFGYYYSEAPDGEGFVMSSNKVNIDFSGNLNYEITPAFNEILKIHEKVNFENTITFGQYYEKDPEEKENYITPFDKDINLIFYAKFNEDSSSTITITWNLNIGSGMGKAPESANVMWQTSNFYRNIKTDKIIDSATYKGLSPEEKGNYNIVDEKTEKYDAGQPINYPIPQSEFYAISTGNDQRTLLGYSRDPNDIDFESERYYKYYIKGKQEEDNQLGSADMDNIILYAIWDIPRNSRN